jgi:hypothetical protein
MASKQGDGAMPALKVVYRPLEELKPYERNSRTHSDDQIAHLAQSMLEFGWTNPVLMDDDGIIAGHARVRAAGLLWQQGKDIPRCEKGQVPTIYLGGLTPEQRRAYVIADNQHALNAGWDGEVLKQELHALADAKFDMQLVGFGADELRAFMYPDGAGQAGGGNQAASGEAEDGAPGDGNGEASGAVLKAIDVTIAEPRTEVRKGDVWKVGKHVLICVGVLDEWRLWAPHLDADNALFCPFPGVFVPFGSKAA